VKNLLRFLSYVLVAAVASAATLLLFMPRSQDFAKLGELKTLIDRVFIGDADAKAMEDAAAAAMVEALDDRWSYYMTAEDYQAYLEQMANAYVGIGITITARDDGYIDVTKVEADGPAQKAGMLPGAVIIAVEGTDIGSMDLTAVKNMVRGKEGTAVKITVRRDAETLELEIIRSQIKTVVASGQMLEDNIGYVKIANFDDRCAQETLAIIQQLQQQGAQALIFDVRYNPGGYKHELLQILDHLLPEGPLFRSLDYTGKETVDSSDKDCLELPMAVLINGDSYSAAEFFAAALDEYDAAILVGEATTGKGHFQSSYKLSDGSAAVISVGKYYTPKGVSLADVGGLVPEVVVAVDKETYLEIYNGQVPPQEDTQIQKAVEILRAA